MAEAKKTAKGSEPKTENKNRKQVKEAELVGEAAPVKSVKTPEKAETTAKETAKAGKRSVKALKEAEEKQAKEKRKAEASREEGEKKAKPAVKPARLKVERAGKKYREVAKLIDKSKAYSLTEALELATKTSTTKFDSTVELHINLGVDPKQADQNVRDTVVLPAGTGKNLRVAAMTEPDDEAEAKTAGADITGADKILAQLDKDEINFDVLVAVPSMMAKLGKYARLLGPRGLMPNPKSGTVTTNVEAAVKEAKAGKVEYRVDQSGIVHLAIGKVSFGKDKLAQNAEAVMSSIRSARPASLKGVYIKNITVTTTMGPPVRVGISQQ